MRLALFRGRSEVAVERDCIPIRQVSTAPIYLDGARNAVGSRFQEADEEVNSLDMWAWAEDCHTPAVNRMLLQGLQSSGYLGSGHLYRELLRGRGDSSLLRPIVQQGDQNVVSDSNKNWRI